MRRTAMAQRILTTARLRQRLADRPPERLAARPVATAPCAVARRPLDCRSAPSCQPAGLAGFRVEQPVQMNDEIAHMGIVHGGLRLGFPGRLGASCSRERCRRCRARRDRGTRCRPASSARRRTPDAEAVSFRPLPAMSFLDSTAWKRAGLRTKLAGSETVSSTINRQPGNRRDHRPQEWAAAGGQRAVTRIAPGVERRLAARGRSIVPPASRRIRSAAAMSQSCAFGLTKVASSVAVGDHGEPVGERGNVGHALDAARQIAGGRVDHRLRPGDTAGSRRRADAPAPRRPCSAPAAGAAPDRLSRSPGSRARRRAAAPSSTTATLTHQSRGRRGSRACRRSGRRRRCGAQASRCGASAVSSDSQP